MTDVNVPSVSDRQKNLKEKTHFLLISGTSLKKRAESVAGLKAMCKLREQVQYMLCTKYIYNIYFFSYEDSSLRYTVHFVRL